MENKIKEFKAQRDLFKNPVSTLLDASRAKLEITEDRKVKGYAIVWGSKNDYNEIVLKGATLNSLNARGVGSSSGNPILVLNQHRQTEPLCRPTVLQEDDYGLYFEGDIIEGVEYANNVVNQVNQGVLRQLSYGFNYIWDKTEYDATNDAYILKEIKLGEISLVTFSSDENAQLRSFNQLQERAVLDKFSAEQINDLHNLLATRAVTNTPKTEDVVETNKGKVTIF
jgi:HK97 family phage prohead protease